MAHVTQLGHQGIIPAATTLNEIRNEYREGKWGLTYEQEDVHMNVEATLIRKIGMDMGGRMHTCRSRNDQVVLDSKMYARKRLLELRAYAANAVEAFLKKSEGQLDNVAIGYTHVQHAQPISVAFWLTQYASELLRDLKRLKEAYDTTDESPLGAGAISGTSFPIDRQLSGSLLGFQRTHDHALDAIGSRDFLLQVTSANAILYSTLSRLADEVIMWSSYEFRTLALDDGFAMGSSMMPNKKNPGTVELLRGRSGRINGYNLGAFDMVKGLPSGYNRDFHEDKEILVGMFAIMNPATDVVTPLIQTTTINTERMAYLIERNFSTATELANYLVSKHDVPFRQAHHIVGSLVGSLHRAGKDFSDFEACLSHLQKEGVKTAGREGEVRSVLSPRDVMRSYNCLGGTGPKAVQLLIETCADLQKMIDQMYARLQSHRADLEKDKQRVETARQATDKIVAEAGSIKSIEDIKALVKKYRPAAVPTSNLA